MTDEHAENSPKIHVDSDWKAEVQAEKEQLAQKEELRKETGDEGEQPKPGELPPADFKALMGIFASQAVMGLGSMTDPKTGGVVVDLAGAKFAIDLLAVIQEKTTGNIEEKEAEEMKQRRRMRRRKKRKKTGRPQAIYGHRYPCPALFDVC